MAHRVLELFGCSTASSQDWKRLLKRQKCPFLGNKCVKIRKSDPEVAIGTCTVAMGSEHRPLLVCPHRFLDGRQVFTDCMHLLSLHEPGNALHVVAEVGIPGGSVDYFLVSVRRGKAVDFVGIELQTLDTTGTVWPHRQRFLKSAGLTIDRTDADSKKTFGVNWKMTAKTTLVQLHHKVETFEHLSKHLVLVLQDCLLDYMQSQFAFAGIRASRLGDALHFHSYAAAARGGRICLELIERRSTDAEGMAAALGLQATARVELTRILDELQRTIGPDTLLQPA